MCEDIFIVVVVIIINDVILQQTDKCVRTRCAGVNGFGRARAEEGKASGACGSPRASLRRSSVRRRVYIYCL